MSLRDYEIESAARDEIALEAREAYLKEFRESLTCESASPYLAREAKLTAVDLCENPHLIRRYHQLAAINRSMAELEEGSWHGERYEDLDEVQQWLVDETYGPCPVDLDEMLPAGQPVRVLSGDDAGETGEVLHRCGRNIIFAVRVEGEERFYAADNLALACDPAPENAGTEAAQADSLQIPHHINGVPEKTAAVIAGTRMVDDVYHNAIHDAAGQLVKQGKGSWSYVGQSHSCTVWSSPSGERRPVSKKGGAK